MSYHSAPNILQDPNPSGNFHDRKDDAVGGERHFHDTDFGQDHPGGAFKVRHAERFSSGFPRRRIEVYAPDVEESGPAGDEVDPPAIGRPSRFVIVVFGFGDAPQFAARSRNDVDGRDSVLRLFFGVEADPLLIGGKASLIEIHFRMRGDQAHLRFGLWGGRNREQVDSKSSWLVI